MKWQEVLEKAKATKFEAMPQDLEPEPKVDKEEVPTYSKLYNEAASFPCSLHTHMDPQLQQE